MFLRPNYPFISTCRMQLPFTSLSPHCLSCKPGLLACLSSHAWTLSCRVHGFHTLPWEVTLSMILSIFSLTFSLNSSTLSSHFSITWTCISLAPVGHTSWHGHWLHLCIPLLCWLLLLDLHSFPQLEQGFQDRIYLCILRCPPQKPSSCRENPHLPQDPCPFPSLPLTPTDTPLCLSFLSHPHLFSMHLKMQPLIPGKFP